MGLSNIPIDTDLCVGLFAALMDGFLEFTDDTWMLGKSLCKIHQFLKSVAVDASIYILVMMSIDRALVVTEPLQRFNTGSRFRWLAIVSSWFIATFLSIPLAVLFETIDIGNGTQICHIHFDDPKWWKVLLTTSFLFVFIIPVVMMISSYVALVSVLCRRYRLGRISSIRNGSVRSSRTMKHSSSFIFNSGISRSKFRSIQLALGVVSGFIICWSPYFVYNMLHVFDVIKEHNVRKPILILAYLHNVANPIIYFIYHRTLSCRLEISPSLEKTQSLSSTRRLRKLTKEKSCQDNQNPKCNQIED
ncbi:hypothetical protein CHS0354_025859 [Potamilus streckersoni]|uniref:G-protein coupled receptors family 1 profile domain-containing protein n=1 Tax=Potamilus streckersoni TaxID=2493646 RepID=A0AAE0SBD4_9BIVA|nr:hypothetical protein CHS0354_025859 [Potamilus streckersoni]